MLLETLGVILILAIALHCYVRCGRVGKLLSKLPGAYAWPVVGNTFDFVKPADELWPFILSQNKKYGPVYRVWAPHWAIVNVLHPDDIEIILSSSEHIEKSVIYQFLERWLRKGLLTSTGAKWQHRRKMLTPAFHFNILKKYMEVIIEHGDRMVNSIKSEGKDEVVLNINQFITKFTLSTICETAMGTPLSDTDYNAEKYREAVHIVGEQIYKRFFTMWPVPDCIYYNLIPFGIKEKRSVKLLHDFSIKIIQERKQYHEKTDGKYLEEIRSNKVDENDDDGLHLTSVKSKRKRLAMLDLLIAASNDGLIDDDGILEEVNTFIFEGNDTTAAAMTYVIQLLGEHTEIQAKVREEVNDFWDSCNGKFTISDFNKLCLLERCIKESLRLFPSVPYISRRLREDLQLKKYLIPSGVLVQIMKYDLHRKPEFWPEPHKFDPDRFLPENILNRHPFSYIPFSGGPRNCIGQRLAMLEMKIFCLFLIRNFHFESQRPTEVNIKPDLVLRPLKPFYVKFTPTKR